MGRFQTLWRAEMLRLIICRCHEPFPFQLLGLETVSYDNSERLSEAEEWEDLRA